MKRLSLILFLAGLGTLLLAQPSTDLRSALKKYDLPTIQAAVKAGADVNHVYGDGQTPLTIAARGTFIFERRMEIVSWLLEQGAEVNQAGKKGETPLFGAASAPDRDMVKLFLDKGAKVNVRNEEDQTALHAALGNPVSLTEDHIRVAKLLIEAGADPNVRDSKGNLAFHLACAHRPSLESSGQIGGQLLVLAQFLAERGALLDAPNAALKSPLYYCIENEYAAAAAFLLDQNANLRHPPGLDKAMLHLTADYANVELTDLLLNYGADPNPGLASNYSIGQNDYFIPSRSTPLDLVSIHLKESADAEKKKDWKKVAALLKKAGGHQVTYKEYMRRMH